MLKSNGECFERFKEFKAFVEMQLEYVIKEFQLVNWKDFILEEFEVCLMEYNIYHMLWNIAPMECANCTIMVITKAMFYAQNLKKQNWWKCGLYTQLMPKKTLLSIISKEPCNMMRPCVAYIHIFESITIAWFPQEEQQVWCKRYQMCVYCILWRYENV